MEMSTIIVLLVSQMKKSMSPIYLSTSVLVLSVMITPLIFKTTTTSWLPFVMMLTFSSGMMTLFMYTASIAPNEKNKNSKQKILFLIMLTSLAPVYMTTKKNNLTMKLFSSQTLILMLGFILIMTMVALSLHGHSPSQTMTSSF